MKIWALFLLMSLVPATLVAGDKDLTAQEREAGKWMKKYREWAVKYDNQAHQDKSKMKPRPEPPEWLSAVCAAEDVPAGTLTHACDLLREITTDDPVALQISRARSTARTMGEKHDHTSFLQMIHVDAGWMRSATYSRGQGIYGLVGVHFAIPLPGYRKVDLTIPPGFLLLNMPNMKGERSLNIGLPMAGGSLQAFGFKLFNRKMAGHVNLARVWVAGSTGNNPSAISRGQWVDMMGFSVSFKDN